MGDHVKGLAEVQDHHISLDSSVVGSEEVMHSGKQLGLRGVSRSEAVVSITEYVVLFQVVSKVRQMMCSSSLQATDVSEIGL